MGVKTIDVARDAFCILFCLVGVVIFLVLIFLLMIPELLLRFFRRVREKRKEKKLREEAARERAEFLLNLKRLHDKATRKRRLLYGGEKNEIEKIE